MPAGLIGYTWLVGFACGVRAGVECTGIELCAEHAGEYNRIRRAMGQPPALIENLSGDGSIPPPVTLECFVTRAEFEQIKSIAKAAASFEGVEKAVREVLGDEAWARFDGQTVGFTPCATVPDERFRAVAS